MADSGLTGAEIEKECDLVLNYMEKGLILCKRISDGENAEDKSNDGTPGNSKETVKRKTRSIQSLLKENQEKEKEKANKVSAKLSVNHILPDSEKSHNTRSTTPLRQTPKFQRKTAVVC